MEIGYKFNLKLFIILLWFESYSFFRIETALKAETTIKTIISKSETKIKISKLSATFAWSRRPSSGIRCLRSRPDPSLPPHRRRLRRRPSVRRGQPRTRPRTTPRTREGSINSELNQLNSQWTKFVFILHWEPRIKSPLIKLNRKSLYQSPNRTCPNMPPNFPKSKLLSVIK